MNRKSLFLIIAGILVLGFVAAILIFNTEPGDERGSNALERSTAPVKGAADAKVTIVEFLDPACGTCAQFYGLTSHLVEQYEGKVKLMVRYAPLHPGSDRVVEMLEAARLQGKFWPALELLFRNQNRWVVNHQSQPQRARAILKSMALDHARLDADILSQEVTGAVKQDVSDAQTLGVRATPEFFVNGKPLPSFGYEQLEQLVGEAVEANY